MLLFKNNGSCKSGRYSAKVVDIDSILFADNNYSYEK